MPVGASNQRGRRPKQPRASRGIITVYFILTRCPDPSLWLVKLWLLRVANTPDKQAILRLWGSGKRGDFYSHTTYCDVCLLCYQAKGIVHPTDHEFEERDDEDDHESDIEADHSFTDDMDDNEYASDQAGEDEQTRT
ncbi:hypothetical protein L207DRAFT_532619 [Hyaloscypha variabilis F]|uniref:Uncharacterized protein n=1 Tax=Hyaloscypha variabilis (strain UAMH 11265 / GT02V1 / F) TaxID=1149755 RepID=A0A2J6REX8_HYAVF|nr:hypothetical protein L207DRAFT_532619 [Hyaloscypha variabilis F]